MADIGPDKYLLLKPGTGSLQVRLYDEPPWHRPIVHALIASLDHVMNIQHAQGSLAVNWIASGVLLLAIVWLYLKRGARRLPSLSLPVAVGLGCVAWRGGYAMARRAVLAALYESWLRTMDLAFEINPAFVAVCFVTAVGGSWLVLADRSLWWSGVGLLGVLFPNWLIAGFWLAMTALINALAQARYGLPLYGYGGGLMPLIACAVEGVPVCLILWGSRRWLSLRGERCRV